MPETVFFIAKISVTLFLMYIIFKKIGRVFSLSDVMELMKASLVIGAGNISSRRKDYPER